MECSECFDSGLIEWACSEGTCDYSRWCDCPAAEREKTRLEEARQQYLVRQEARLAEIESERIRRADASLPAIRARWKRLARQKNTVQLSLFEELP